MVMNPEDPCRSAAQRGVSAGQIPNPYASPLSELPPGNSLDVFVGP